MENEVADIVAEVVAEVVGGEKVFGNLSYKDITDPFVINELIMDRDSGMTWGAVETKYGMKSRNGMNAYCLYDSYKPMKKGTPIVKVKTETVKIDKPVVVKPEVKPVVVKKVENQHPAFNDVLAIVSCREHAMLVGPAGSGKTSAAEMVAEIVFGRKDRFYPMSVGSQTTMSHLFGYMSADGNYIKTCFRTAYEFGGLFLLDEVDAGNPNVLVALNAALANDCCSFPDAIVARHPDFVCIAAANTWGNGASREYVGRNQLDAATLDRFCKIIWNYDEKFELAITPNREWTKRVQALRAAVAAVGQRVMVTPRTSLRGAKLLAIGMSRDSVEDVCIWNAVDKSVKDKVLEYMRNR